MTTRSPRKQLDAPLAPCGQHQAQLSKIAGDYSRLLWACAKRPYPENVAKLNSAAAAGQSVLRDIYSCADCLATVNNAPPQLPFAGDLETGATDRNC